MPDLENIASANKLLEAVIVRNNLIKPAQITYENTLKTLYFVDSKKLHKAELQLLNNSICILDASKKQEIEGLNGAFAGLNILSAPINTKHNTLQYIHREIMKQYSLIHIIAWLSTALTGYDLYRLGSKYVIGKLNKFPMQMTNFGKITTAFKMAVFLLGFATIKLCNFNMLLRFNHKYDKYMELQKVVDNNSAMLKARSIIDQATRGVRHG